MASTLNAKSTGVGGIDATGDTSGILALQTGGVTALTIDTSQNVGIGTTSPSYKLQTSGGNVAFTNTAGNVCNVEIAGNGNTPGTNSFVIQQATTSDTLLWNRANANLTFGTNATERMRITSAGIILGNTTSSPTGGGVALALSGNGSANSNAGIQAGWNGASPGGYAITTPSGAGTIFYTFTGLAGAETYTERMRIDSSGNVGIGTSSPSVKLDVNAGTTSGTSFDALVLKGGANSTSGSGAKLFLSGGVGTARAAIIQGLATDNANAHAMVFYTNQSSTDPVERMRIDSSGNVLVGTTSNFASGNVQGIAAQASGNASLALNRTTDTGAVARFYQAGTNVGRIEVTGSATTYVTSSDYRLKENVQPMVDALDKVAQLKPVTYTWKSDGSDGQGFIAHELQAVVPECVVGEKDAVNEDGSIDPQGIDTSFLVATLVAAIQELKAEIDELKSKQGQ